MARRVKARKARPAGEQDPAGPPEPIVFDLSPAELKRVRQKVGVKAGKAGVVVRVKRVGRKLFVTDHLPGGIKNLPGGITADAGRLAPSNAAFA
jgi:hypothetical protein